MRNKRAALAAAPLSLALLLAACGSDDDSADANDPTTTTEAVTTTAPSPPSGEDGPSTTGPPTTAPPDATAPSSTSSPPAAGDAAALPSTPEDWMVELVRAWGAGDGDRAEQLATDEVLAILFGYADPGGIGWSLVGCDYQTGQSSCTFETDAGETTGLAQPTAPEGEPLPPVNSARVTGSDDLTLGEPARALVRAWGAGDRAQATTYAHPEVVDTLFDRYDPGGPDWDLRDCLTVDEDPQCIFYDQRRNVRLIVHFDDTALPDDVVVSSAEFRDGASG